MSEPFKYGSCSIYRTPLWVSLPSDPEVAVLLKPLSHYTLNSMVELQYLYSKDSKFNNPMSYRDILITATVNLRNFIDFPNFTIAINQISHADIIFLYDTLLNISSISITQLNALDEMLDIQFNPQFSEDSWNCTICKEKKLDYTRGCGFLSEDARDSSPVLPKINGKRFDVCPISTLDGYATQQASLAHSLMTFGTLPEDGGIGNQTEWFVKAAMLYKRKIAQAERAAVEDRKKK